MASSHVGRKTAQDRLRALTREKTRKAKAEAEAKLSEEEKARAAKDAEGKTLIERWASDPVLCARQCFGRDLTREQVRIVLSVATGHDPEALSRREPREYTAVKAGQKTGKTFLAAFIVYWLAICYGYDRINLMSATGQNLKNILWSEVRKLWKLSQLAEHPVGCDEPPLNPQTGFRIGNTEVVGVVGDSASTLGGYSGKQIWIVDEASGEAFDIMWPAIVGNTTGGGKILILGNPIRPAGEFYAVWRKPEHRATWNAFTLSSVDASKYGIPYMADPKVIALRLQTWGKDSPLYKERVLGEFSDAGNDAIVAVSWWDAATHRYEELLTEIRDHKDPSNVLRVLSQERIAPYVAQQLNLGVDVARFGDDDSVIYPRRGPLFFEPIVVHGLDTIQLVEAILKTADGLGKPGEVVKVKIDTTGSAGAYDLLAQSAGERKVLKAAAKHGGRLSEVVQLVVVPINVSERATSKPSDTDRGYMRLRDQLWFAGAYFLRDEAIVPPNMKLEEELLTPTYTVDTSGRYVAESKADVKKRLKRSPDLADAFCMAVYEGSPAVEYSGKVVNLPAPSWGSAVQTAWGDGDSKPWGI